ncbi:MAG: hypothetical protein R3264_15615, partial [Anaerolineae bacterium]|nr:hypothetical protein [Anaerolineae bacterium]
ASATASPVTEPTTTPTGETSSQPTETAEPTIEPTESTETEPTHELTPEATVAVTATPTAVTGPTVTMTPRVELTTTITSGQPGTLPDMPAAEATPAETDQSAGQATGIIEGGVRYQGRVDYTGIEVKVTGPEHEILGTNEGSQFAIKNLTAGDYSVVVDAERYLPTCAAVTVDAAGIINLSQAVLYGGDTDDDDQIRINDVTLIGSNLGLTSSTTPPMNPRADINADGQVNIQDLSILGGNFEKKGCQKWSTETPIAKVPTTASS